MAPSCFSVPHLVATVAVLSCGIGAQRVGSGSGVIPTSRPPTLPKNRTCVVESGFDYVGYDFKNVSSASAGDCCAQCGTQKTCRAYTWTTLNGGTCFFKSDRGEIVVNADAKSGLELYVANPTACVVEKGVDYEGFDIGSAPSTVAGACCEICRASLGCRAYSWSTYQGGTCWLKSKRGTRVRRTGVLSATVYPASIYDPPFEQKCVLEYGVDMTGETNDLAYPPSATAEGCCEICAAYSECRAFTWTGYNGGTCWLKRSATRRIAGLADDIVSGVVSK